MLALIFERLSEYVTFKSEFLKDIHNIIQAIYNYFLYPIRKIMPLIGGNDFSFVVFGLLLVLSHYFMTQYVCASSVHCITVTNKL